MRLLPLEKIAGPQKQALAIEALTRLARQLGPGIKMPTTQELAQSLGVTWTTLDRALRKMKEQGIVNSRRGSGVYVSSRAFEKTICLVFGRDVFSPGVSPFHSILLEQCARRAASHQERFSFFLDVPGLDGSLEGLPVHSDLAAMVRSGKIDGLLVSSVNNEEQALWLRSQNIPVVFFGFGSGGTPNRVYIDFEQLISKAARELVKKGCRTVGLFAIFPDHAAVFKRIASDAGLSWEEKWISCEENSNHEMHNRREMLGRNGIERMLSQAGSLPDGLIVLDDILTLGICSRLESKRIRVGKRVKIATHANKGSLALSEWEDVLIRCEIDPKESAEAMFSMLEALMSGRLDGPQTTLICARPVN